MARAIPRKEAARASRRSLRATKPYLPRGSSNLRLCAHELRGFEETSDGGVEGKQCRRPVAAPPRPVRTAGSSATSGSKVPMIIAASPRSVLVLVLDAGACDKVVSTLGPPRTAYLLLFSMPVTAVFAWSRSRRGLVAEDAANNYHRPGPAAPPWHRLTRRGAETGPGRWRDREE